MSSDPLILVDGSSYLYRAFHAATLTTSDGRPTSAIFGVLNMLKRLRDDYQSEHFVVIFDARGKNFREEIYAEYKANRSAMPEELSQQVAPLQALIRAQGFPILEVPGVEADDVIGTLARQASAAGLKVVISSGDKDLAQLVDERVTLVDTMYNKRFDRSGVEGKFGVPPERIVDYLALVGDSSDNIPGVEKVGPKTAAKWLSAYGDLEGVKSNASSIKGKVGENLRASLEQLDMARQLATIRCDVELPTPLDELRIGASDDTTLRTLYARYELTSWLNEMGPPSPEELSAQKAYHTILEREALETLIARLQTATLIALDTETTSLDYMEAELVGLSFALQPNEAFYIPVDHRYPDAPEQLDRDQVLALLAPILQDPTRPKIGHHLKYDQNVLARYGVELAGIAHDSMLESYVLNATAVNHDLDSLALKYLQHRTIRFEEIAGKGAKQLTFDQVPLEQAAPYASEDADIALQLHQHLWPRLEAVPSMAQLYREVEIPLISVLSRVERTGVAIDREQLRRQSDQLAERMSEVEMTAHEVAGHPFNLGSSKQIGEILYQEMGLPVLKKTPKKQPSTAEDVLQDLALTYELPRLILEWRSLSKLRSTYTERLPEQINAHSGRVHTSYHQAVASTGRLSSSDPNLQNIPVRTEEGRRIRQAFIAPRGHLILAADYSQIELRIMAHLSGDPGLRSAFAEGADIHRATAAEVFGLAPEEVSSDQRRAAKAINFGLIYGMTPFGLAKQLGIPQGEARSYVERYFARYTGVKSYMDSIRAQAYEEQFVETLFGRRLYLPEIRSQNRPRRNYAERTAINAPMQGSAADIIKRAMIGVDDYLARSALSARVIMQVHDELVLEVEEGSVDAVSRDIQGLMTGAAQLSVPLVVDVGVGANWDEAH